MSQPTLDERVALLEREVARLSKLHVQESDKADSDWRATLGMFADDPIMKAIIDEGRKIRQLDRERASE